MVRSAAFLPLVGRAVEADDGAMFSAHCEAEGREVLLTTRRIVAIELRDGETEIRFTCWCGHEGVLVDPAVARPGATAAASKPRQPARPAA